MGNKYMAPSVKKAFEILEAISLSRKGAGVNKIARDLKMAKSTVHGITSILEGIGAIMRDPLTKRYTLGLTLFELGRLAYSQIDLKDLARSIMEELMEKTQESVFLGVLNGERVTILDIVESRQDLKITSPIGTTIPLLAGATGKVFLACMEEEKVKEIIRKKGFIRYTENTITDPEKYLQEIRRVREKGYATDYEEYILGVRAVVSPIKGEGHLVSALWVVGFRTSLNGDKMRALIEMTKEAAEAVSRKIEEQSLR
jgi:DNA-binding IclR family transcriptional regulator